MSVIALSQRAGRHTSQPAGPGRAAPVPRRPTGPAQPALTVTFAIPLGGETLTPQAHRLLEVVRELVESGEGTVTVDPSVPDGVRAGSAADLPAADPADGGAVAVEVALAPPATPHVHELRLLAASRQVLLGGEPLPLTRLEFDLLLFLAQHPRRVFSRVQLLAGVWGYEHTGVRTVDVHVRRLRVKVGETVPLVTTVYGVGYRLADEARVMVVADE